MQPIEVDPAAPFVVVLNHGSGSDDPAATRSVIEGVFGQAAREHEILLVTDASRLRELAAAAVARARERRGVVVAAGGDGTINTVAQATIGSGCPFGVLPQGTFNYFSRTHGIPSDTGQATRLLTTARAHPAQVGWVNDKVFLVNASLGLYPNLLEDREAYKKQWGRSRPVALLAAFMTLLRNHRQLQLSVDLGGQTRELRTPTLFVGNNQLQLDQIGMQEAACVRQGRLAAISLEPVGNLALFWLMLRGAMGQLGAADSVQSFAFRSMTVTPKRSTRRIRMKVAMDGEVSWMYSPLEFRVEPAALMLLRPEDDAVVAE